jgi:hypothetical protein
VAIAVEAEIGTMEVEEVLVALVVVVQAEEAPIFREQRCTERDPEDIEARNQRIMLN